MPPRQAGRPVRPVNMTLQEKRAKIDAIEAKLAEYRDNPQLLLADLEHLPPHHPNNVDGVFDPDAVGYDLLASCPLDQSIKCYAYDNPWETNTVAVFAVYEIKSLGELLYFLIDNERIRNIPGIGPTRRLRLIQGFREHGWPIDEILPPEKPKRKKTG